MLTLTIIRRTLGVHKATRRLPLATAEMVPDFSDVPGILVEILLNTPTSDTTSDA